MKLLIRIIILASSLTTATALAWQTPVGPTPTPTFINMERTTNVAIQDGALQRARVFARTLFLSATGTENAFPSLIDTPPTWMFSREWDAVRLTVRGVGEAEEAITVRFGPNPVFVILR